jgi:hypothetical protein
MLSLKLYTKMEFIIEPVFVVFYNISELQRFLLHHVPWYFFFFFFVLLTLNLNRQLDRFLIVIDLDDCIGQNATNQLCQLKNFIICEQEVAELPRISTDAN